MNDTMNVWDALRTRFNMEEYAFLREVRNKAGFMSSRSADAIAMNLWPSRGLEVHGIEVKSSRSDWLREMKNPQKAESIFKFCDRWWLVAEREGIVKLQEVPSGWGLLLFKKGRLCTEIEASKLHPIPMDRHFVAALMKRATKGMIDPDNIESELNVAREEGRDEFRTRIKQAQNELDSLKKVVAEFEQMSGIHLSGYSSDGTVIGKAVRFILNGGGAETKRELKSLLSQSERIRQTLVDVINELGQ